MTSGFSTFYNDLSSIGKQPLSRFDTGTIGRITKGMAPELREKIAKANIDTRLDTAQNAFLHVSKDYLNSIKSIPMVDDNFGFDGRYFHIGDYPIPINKTQTSVMSKLFKTRKASAGDNLPIYYNMVYNEKMMKFLFSLNKANKYLKSLVTLTNKLSKETITETENQKIKRLADQAKTANTIYNNMTGNLSENIPYQMKKGIVDSYRAALINENLAPIQNLQNEGAGLKQREYNEKVNRAKAYYGSWDNYNNYTLMQKETRRDTQFQDMSRIIQDNSWNEFTRTGKPVSVRDYGGWVENYPENIWYGLAPLDIKGGAKFSDIQIPEIKQESIFEAKPTIILGKEKKGKKPKIKPTSSFNDVGERIYSSLPDKTITNAAEIVEKMLNAGVKTPNLFIGTASKKVIRGLGAAYFANKKINGGMDADRDINTFMNELGLTTKDSGIVWNYIRQLSYYLEANA